MTVVDVVRARVTDGQHRWGRLTVRPVDRTLWSSRTLTVFAPGTSRRESAWLRAWHAWVVVGAAAAVVTLAATSALPAAAPVEFEVVWADVWNALPPRWPRADRASWGVSAGAGPASGLVALDGRDLHGDLLAVRRGVRRGVAGA